MKMIDVNGNITMIGLNNLPIIIANVKYGTTYGSKDEKDMRTAMLTIFPGHNKLQDSFIFYDKENIPFTFLQSRNLNPTLKEIYIDFLVNENDKTMDNLLSMVMTHYFLEKLGYSFPSN